MKRLCFIFKRSDPAIQNMAVKLGLRKHPSFCNEGCFRKGMVPWNRGLKGYMGANRTSFRKGNKPWTWLPVGSERISKDGTLQRKVSDTGYGPRDWKAVHAILWESVHGPVPKGHIVVFKAGISKEEKLRPVIGSLECISRVENM